jgi:ClpP class serine protease
MFEILDAQWLIHKPSALSYLPVLISFLNGGKISLETSDYGGSCGCAPSTEQKPHVFAMGDDPINPVDRYELESSDIPDDSVAVIPISGVILSWKLMELVRYIQMAENNPRIISIIFLVNSPGGMLFYLDSTAAIIKAASKPTVSVVMNMAASAAMWLISATGYRIATSTMDQIGSIGVRTSYMDFNKFLKEKLGIGIYEIYASKSTRKDEEIRALLEKESDESLVLAKSDFINEEFHRAIRTNLGLKEDSEVFTGAIYFSEQAKELGLINEVNTLNYAFEYAHRQGLKNKIKQFQFT